MSDSPPQMLPSEQLSLPPNSLVVLWDMDDTLTGPDPEGNLRLRSDDTLQLLQDFQDAGATQIMVRGLFHRKELAPEEFKDPCPWHDVAADELQGYKIGGAVDHHLTDEALIQLNRDADDSVTPHLERLGLQPFFPDIRYAHRGKVRVPGDDHDALLRIGAGAKEDIFKKILEETGLPASQFLVVGDSGRDEIEAAQKLGIQSCKVKPILHTYAQAGDTDDAAKTYLPLRKYPEVAEFLDKARNQASADVKQPTKLLKN